MSIKDFEKNLDITIHEGVERNLNLFEMIGVLEYFKANLVRAIQEVSKETNEQ